MMAGVPTAPARMAERREAAGTKPAGAKPAGEPRKVYLYPGQLFAAAEPCTVTTILGSCVAVCLWDSVSRVGGICHFLLPHWAGPGQASSRFGNVAMEQLIEKVLALGARRRDLRAKMFGGARVLDTSPQEGGRHLGARNVDVAREMLAQEGIAVVAKEVGGNGGRKLIFDSGTGTAWVRKF